MMTATPNPKFGVIYAIIALISLTIFTTLTFIPILLIGLLKLFPNEQWRITCTKGIDKMAAVWTGLTTGYVNRYYPIQLNITGTTQFNRNEWYLVVANHQSWLDIIIFKTFFIRKYLF